MLVRPLKGLGLFCSNSNEDSFCIVSLREFREEKSMGTVHIWYTPLELSIHTGQSLLSVEVMSILSPWYPWPSPPMGSGL